MDIGSAINFAFEDQQWVSKILVGALLALIPIFGQLVIVGYTIAVLRNVKNDRHILPTWDRIGDYFMEGLMFWIATLVYSLPLLILLCPIALVWILPVAAGESEELATALAGVSGIVSMGLGCIAMLYGILFWLLAPVLQIRYAETGKIGPCLRFGEIFRFMFDNIGDIVVAQLLVWVASFVVSIVLGGVIGVVNIVPICGQIVGFFLSLLGIPVGIWLAIFASHLYGQISRRAGPVPTVMI